MCRWSSFVFGYVVAYNIVHIVRNLKSGLRLAYFFWPENIEFFVDAVSWAKATEKKGG